MTSRAEYPAVGCEAAGGLVCCRQVAKPNIGERRPARVRADVTVNLSVRPEVKAEWEGLRKHDVCFLVTVRPQMGYGERPAVTVKVLQTPAGRIS